LLIRRKLSASFAAETPMRPPFRHPLRGERGMPRIFRERFVSAMLGSVTPAISRWESLIREEFRFSRLRDRGYHREEGRESRGAA